MLLFAAVSSAAALGAPYLIGGTIDFIKDGQTAQIIKNLIGLGIVFACAALFNWLMYAEAARLAQKITKALRDEAFGKLLTMPLKTLDGLPAGEVTSRFVNDAEAVAEALYLAVSQIFPGILTITGCMAIMLLIDYRVAAVIVVVAPLALLVAAFITRNTRRIFVKQQAEIGAYNAYIDEMIGGQKVVRAFSHESKMQEEAGVYNARLYEIGQKAMFFSSLVHPATRFINNIAYALIGLAGGLIAVADGGLTVGQISALISYSVLFSKPMNEMTAAATQFQAGFAAAARLFGLLDFQSEPDEAGKEETLFLSGGVEFKDVCFSYSPDVKLIENFNLKVKAGQTAAIVGKTGAGKTTLVNLIMRFYEPDGGEILIGGVPVNSVKRESVRAAFGMVLQDSYLFSGTIRDNIAYGMPSATDEEITAAAKAAHAYGFISRTEKGFDTVISGGAGGSLSAGQKQLLTIARATLKNPPMLILDEATSSVDTRTEKLIQSGLQEIRQGKTSFIIAHRLSTIANADIIIVMENGSIAETGTHAELLAKNSVYAEMYKNLTE